MYSTCSFGGTITAVSHHIFFSKLDSAWLTLLSEKRQSDKESCRQQLARLRQGGQLFCRREMYSLFSPTNKPVQNVPGRKPVSEWRDHPSISLSVSVYFFLPQIHRWMVDMEEISTARFLSSCNTIPTGVSVSLWQSCAQLCAGKNVTGCVHLHAESVSTAVNICMHTWDNFCLTAPCVTLELHQVWLYKDANTHTHTLIQQAHSMLGWLSGSQIKACQFLSCTLVHKCRESLNLYHLLIH